MSPHGNEHGRVTAEGSGTMATRGRWALVALAIAMLPGVAHADPPAAPVDVHARPGRELGTIDVTWNHPADRSGIDGYSILIETPTCAVFFCTIGISGDSVPPDRTAYTLEGQPGRRYIVTVRTFNESEQSAGSPRCTRPAPWPVEDCLIDVP